MNDRIIVGKEHGVEWKIDNSKFQEIIICVKSLTTGEEETKVYKCLHNPIFGYDVADNANIEKILDDLIIKYANDGYGIANNLSLENEHISEQMIADVFDIETVENKKTLEVYKIPVKIIVRNDSSSDIPFSVK